MQWRRMLGVCPPAPRLLVRRTAPHGSPVVAPLAEVKRISWPAAPSARRVPCTVRVAKLATWSVTPGSMVTVTPALTVAFCRL